MRLKRASWVVNVYPSPASTSFRRRSLGYQLRCYHIKHFKLLAVDILILQLFSMASKAEFM